MSEQRDLVELRMIRCTGRNLLVIQPQEATVPGPSGNFGPGAERHRLRALALALHLGLGRRCGRRAPGGDGASRAAVLRARAPRAAGVRATYHQMEN